MHAPSATSPQAQRISRIQWTIRGQVQGVGFRPFIYRVAQRCGVSGWIRNDSAGARIQIQGTAAQLARFDEAMQRELPPLAVVRGADRKEIPLQTDKSFAIAPSAQELPGDGDVSIDTAVCVDCQRELRDRRNRRHRYALTNCTNCGPRFSIIHSLPYDRCNTTMRRFAMCSDCLREYKDPSDRRFHAQPIACRNCGPQVMLIDRAGRRLNGDPIREARRILLDGKMVAIKGLGAFHLAVRADRTHAVRRLRDLKHRPYKPLAVMIESLVQAHRIVEISPHGASLLSSPTAPILLCNRRDTREVCELVAPSNHRLGVMLPYTPLHHLLFCDGAMPPLVMTSANNGGEPLVIANWDALGKLGSMCDAFLLHDRPIHRGVDDSVLIDLENAAPIPIRRARGFVPTPISIPGGSGADGIAVGGELKSTVALVRNGQVILSQHLGDLSHPESFALFRRTIVDLQSLFNVQPAWIAHDLHPGYLSTKHATRLAAEKKIPLIGVQHHHAHAAAVMAEHGITKPVVAIVCDGTGFGEDRSIWGGELLHVHPGGFERVANLAPLRLPGGDASALDPRRSAAALLYHVLGDNFAYSACFEELGFDPDERDLVSQMILRNVSCVQSSSAGRLFDAVAALLGICRTNQFEAQAALALESAAAAASRRTSSFCEPGDTQTIDFATSIREMLLRLRRGEDAKVLAAMFQEEFARGWATVAAQHAHRRGISTVALSGGVFSNAWLTGRITQLLLESDLQVLRHQQVPPNDGGLALGQAAVAAWRVRDRKAGA